MTLTILMKSEQSMYLLGVKIMRTIDADHLYELVQNSLRDNPHDKGILRSAHIVEHGHFLKMIENAPMVEPVVTGDTSDGYHTFNELYHHRAVLFSVIVKAFPDQAWKSKKHSDGSMYDGMFIVGIDTPYGQATYHYDIDPYWDMFRCKELEHAPEFDGHTAADAIERIGKLEPVRHGRWIENRRGFLECSECKFERIYIPLWMKLNYCPNCSAKMDLEDTDEV